MYHVSSDRVPIIVLAYREIECADAADLYILVVYIPPGIVLLRGSNTNLTCIPKGKHKGMMFDAYKSLAIKLFLYMAAMWRPSYEYTVDQCQHCACLVYHVTANFSLARTCNGYLKSCG